MLDFLMITALELQILLATKIFFSCMWKFSVVSDVEKYLRAVKFALWFVLTSIAKIRLHYSTRTRLFICSVRTSHTKKKNHRHLFSEQQSIFLCDERGTLVSFWPDVSAVTSRHVSGLTGHKARSRGDKGGVQLSCRNTRRAHLSGSGERRARGRPTDEDADRDQAEPPNLICDRARETRYARRWHMQPTKWRRHGFGQELKVSRSDWSIRQMKNGVMICHVAWIYLLPPYKFIG
jgi:hypothetical protein